MSDLDDLSFACRKVISVKEEVEICETQLLEQIFDRFQVTHVDPCVNIEKENEVVNEIIHVTEDDQTELKDCEVIREQLYECYLRPDNSTSSARKHDDIRPSMKNNRTCSICAKSFRFSSRLKDHMNVHTGSRPYACTICPKKYASHDHLRAHILTHGSGFKCAFCEKSYKSRSGMNKHIKTHHGERNFQCEICSKSFTSKYLLSSHHKTHLDKKKYECTLCSKKFAENSKRLKHEKTHTNNHRNYECENCKKYFRSEDQYRSHMKGNKCKCYASEKQFECSKCENESFVSIELLNQHKVEIHTPRKENHICLICTKTYKHKCLLDTHMNSHTGSRPYTCPICPKRFACPGSLSRHKLDHNFLSADGKIRGRFKCTLCEKSYFSKTSLNSHMYFHRGERPFKCEICPKSYINQYTLKAHIKLHFDERKYECTLCSKKFAVNSNRLRHEKTHTNNHRNYECENCKKYFRSEHQYRSHMKGNKCKCNASEKLFKCSECENKSFVSIELLNQHKIEVHPPPRKNQACSLCTKTFRCKYELRVHMNIHTGSRPYSCTICPKKYSSPFALRIHKLSHAGAKNRSKYKCTLCEKLCSSMGRLSGHMNKHRGERPFKCETCLKTFTSSESLYTHKRYHSSDKKYECTLCNKRFIYNSQRRKHEMSHLNHRLPYQCDVCKEYFQLEDQYRSHLADNKCNGNSQESHGRENESSKLN